jgi:hypothetical protein
MLFSAPLRRGQYIVRRMNIGRRCLTSKPYLSEVEDDEKLMKNFRLHLEKRQPREALQILNSFSTPPSSTLIQRLAILLAKKASRQEAKDALAVLKKVYMYDFLIVDLIFTLLSLGIPDCNPMLTRS